MINMNKIIEGVENNMIQDDQTMAKKGKRIKMNDTVEKFNLEDLFLDGGSAAGI